VGVHLFAGELQAAASLIEQSDALADATSGRVVPLCGALALAAFRGRKDEVTRLVRTGTQDFITRGEGLGLTVSQWVTAVLYNGLARYEDAFTAAAAATADPHELWFSTFALVELVEAASRSGNAHRAAGAVELSSESTRATSPPWGLGVEARSRALLTDGEPAEALYRAAIDHLQATRLRIDLARSHLLYGEWLRRQRRRLDAPVQLRVAHELFSDFGMEAFAARTAVELEATGERAGDGPSARMINSLPRRRSSPVSPRAVTRTERSPLSCSSGRAGSSVTSARCSGGSTSGHARSSPVECPSGRGPAPAATGQ
jgi:hypothetical protein